MNAFDLLNEKEKNILSLLIKGLSMAEVADMYDCTTYEINRTRLQIIDKIDKFEESIAGKTHKASNF